MWRRRSEGSRWRSAGSRSVWQCRRKASRTGFRSSSEREKVRQKDSFHWGWARSQAISSWKEDHWAGGGDTCDKPAALSGIEPASGLCTDRDGADGEGAGRAGSGETAGLVAGRWEFTRPLPFRASGVRLAVVAAGGMVLGSAGVVHPALALRGRPPFLPLAKRALFRSMTGRMRANMLRVMGPASCGSLPSSAYSITHCKTSCWISFDWTFIALQKLR